MWKKAASGLSLWEGNMPGGFCLLSNKCIFSEADTEQGENNYSLRPHLPPPLSLPLGRPSGQAPGGPAPAAPPPAATPWWCCEYEWWKTVLHFQFTVSFLLQKNIHVCYLKSENMNKKHMDENTYNTTHSEDHRSIKLSVSIPDHPFFFFFILSFTIFMCIQTCYLLF